MIDTPYNSLSKVDICTGGVFASSISPSITRFREGGSFIIATVVYADCDNAISRALAKMDSTSRVADLTWIPSRREIRLNTEVTEVTATKRHTINSSSRVNPLGDAESLKITRLECRNEICIENGMIEKQLIQSIGSDGIRD